MGVFWGNDRFKSLMKKTGRLFAAEKVRSVFARIKDWRALSIAWRGVRTYKYHLLKGVGALGLLSAMILSGNAYVKKNTYEVYHVFVGDREIGVVDSKDKVEQYIAAKSEQVQKDNPSVHMNLKFDTVTYQTERAFKAKSDDASALAALDPLLKPEAIGAKLMVGGEMVAIVKDEQTAQQILDELKNKYTPKSKDGREVGILSASKDAKAGSESDLTLQKVEFTKDVEVDTAPIDPSQLSDPGEVLKQLETGGVEPAKYTVVPGDCISCIAAKFHIDKQVIYDRNPWIVDDMIRPGDVLDITVLQPTLGVRTTETYSEDQEIQYPTSYTLDNSMRKGQVKVTSPGQNGLKKVTFQVTKVNGQLLKEEMIGQEVIRQPVTAQAIKGTLVIKGEGTGNFDWPVSHPKITSGFGSRWGSFHKGLDIVSSNRTIHAADNGKVVFAGWNNGGYGNLVILDHLNGYVTYYAHMSKVLVKKGDTVAKGDEIGIMGQTGDATGVHVHFEVRVNGTPENPLKFLN